MFIFRRTLDVCCLIDVINDRRRHPVACEGRSVALRWQRLTALRQRSAGGVLSFPLRI